MWRASPPENLEHFKRQLKLIRDPVAVLDPALAEVLWQIYDQDRLPIGAAGQLARDGKVDGLATEDAIAHARVTR